MAKYELSIAISVALAAVRAAVATIWLLQLNQPLEPEMLHKKLDGDTICRGCMRSDENRWWGASACSDKVRWWEWKHRSDPYR